MTQLNKEQQEAVLHKDGPCCVIAVPGAGKTKSLVERLATLVNSGVEPASIVCISFTNKAADEMKERAKARIGAPAEQIFISTFHRFCLFILKNYGGGDFGYGKYLSIIDDKEQVSLMSQMARQLGYEFPAPTIKSIVKVANTSREELDSEADARLRFGHYNSAWFPVYEKYVDKLRATKTVDFSSILSECYRLLNEKPAVLQALQAQYKYVQIDETQDSNTINFELALKIFGHTNNIFIVGDPHQSLFSFRGSKPEKMEEFINGKGAKIITFNQNYRSTPQILSVAEKLIRHNPQLVPVDLKTSNADGPPVRCMPFDSDALEAAYIAKTIKATVDAGKCQYKDIAILYRMNAMSRVLETAMVQYNLPYTLKGGFSFFDRTVVKDCLSMLAFYANQQSGIFFQRFANKPKRSLGEAAIGKIEILAEQENISIVEACKKIKVSANARKGLDTIVKAFNFNPEGMNIAQILDQIVTGLNYREFLKDDPETEVDNVQNLEELLRDMARFSEERSNDVVDYLDNIALMSSYDKKDDENSVTLTTGHGAKGGEWTLVFVVGAEQEILPSKMAINENINNIEEERRIFYVLLTRGIRCVIVSWCKQRQQNNWGKKGSPLSYALSVPSQFLYESGLMTEGYARYQHHYVYN